MTRTRLIMVVAVLAVALLPLTVSAQLVSRGSIQGTVLDSTGAVVPGAKITITSSFGSREATTNEQGEFLFLALEPGKYTVRVEKPGFKIAEAKDVNVRLNERANATVTLEPGAISSVVEVTDIAIGIDPTTTTSGGSITAQLFQNVPVGRNITDIPYLVSGVNDSLGVGTANPSIGGATGFENLYIVNGVNITNAGYGAIGTYSNVFGSLGSGVQFDFVKEVQVKTSGFEAQYGQALGGVVNMNTKSGGNATHGGGYFYMAPSALEATRRQANDVRFNRGMETVGVANYDVGGDIGGYLVKDRVFWYGGLNYVWGRQTLRAPANFLARAAFGEVDQSAKIFNYSAKLNINLDKSSKHQFEFSIFGDPSNNPFGPNRPAGSLGGGALQSDFADRQFSKLEYGSRNWTLRYNGAFTNSWLVNGSFNWAHNEFTESGFPNFYGVQDRTEALPTTANSVGDGQPTPGTSRGLNNIGGIGFFENNIGDNKQWAFNGTNIFKAFGGHEVGYGLQFEDVDFAWEHARSGPDWNVPCVAFDGSAIAGITPSDCNRPVFGAQLRLRTGGPAGFRLQQIRGAFTGRTGTTQTKYGALYLQDAWSINKWITLKLGVRVERQRISGENIGYTFSPNWAPRLGVIVDPWGDRKTKIFFNFGRFFEKVPQDLAVRSLSEERSYISYFFAVTNPTSANPLWNNNAVGGATAGCPAGATLAACLNNPANWLLNQAHTLTNTPVFSGGVTNFVPGTKLQYQDEYVVGFEREFRGGIVVGARYVDRRVQRVLEDVAALTVGGANTGVDILGNPLHQDFLLGNPSRGLDAFANTLCVDPNENPTIEDNNPNSANFALGCLVSGYAPGGGAAGSDGLPDGFPNAVRRYRAFEFTIEKRFTKNWQFAGNWRIAKLDGNYEGLFRNDNGQTDPNISSLFDFPFSNNLGDQFTPGVLPTDRRHITNLHASYLFDSGFNLGVGWRLQSGYPVDRLRAHPAYLNQGEVPVGGRGSEGRTPVTSTIDAHADYTWKMSDRFRMKLVADVFNLWNARRLNRIDRFEDTGFVSGQAPALAPNVDFLKPNGAPNAYQRPLNMRLAVRFEF